MTGHAHGEAQPDRRAQPARQQPPVQSNEEEPQESEDQDKIEIPAFLRRQAN
jgi:cell division protein FtsZ